MEEGTSKSLGSCCDTSPNDAHQWDTREDCEVRQILDRIADKWSLLAIALLEGRTLRFNELRREIDGISQRMLSVTLRQLERDGLVLRHVYARVPARVEYELSDTGEALLLALTPLLDWGKSHQDAIAEARERFDRLQLWRAAGQEMQAHSHARQPRVPGVY